MNDVFERFEQVPGTGIIKGGAGSVFQVTPKGRPGPLLALKIIPLTGDIFENSFAREGTALLRLRHENVQKLTEKPFIASLNGEKCGVLVSLWQPRTLQVAIDAREFGSWARLLDKIALPLAKSLSYCHERDVAHRDVKPSNVLLAEDDGVILSDFGIAKPLSPADNSKTVGLWRSGPYTPDFIGSPKNLDVYSFGMTLVAGLLGKCSFSRTEAKNLLTNRTLPLVPGKQLPVWAAEVLSRCIADLPEDRFQSMTEVEIELTKNREDWVRESRTRPISLRIDPSVTKNLRAETLRNRNANRFLREEFENGGICLAPEGDEYGEALRDTFWLITSQLKIRVKKTNVNLLEATHLKHLSPEKLDRERSQAFNLDSLCLTWIVNAPHAEDAPSRGTDLALQNFLDWIDKGMPKQGQIELETNLVDLISKWERILQATEKALTGKGAPLEYDGLQIRGKDARLSLISPPEYDLVGSSWAFVSSNRKLSGEVVLHESDALIIRLEHEPSSKISTKGHISPSLDGGSRSALNRKKDGLDALTRSAALRPDLGELLARPAISKASAAVDIASWNPHIELDDSKKRAVQIVLGSNDFTLVQGPPGTGKTQFIAEVVWQLLQENPLARILLVSQTHVALDNALERIHQSGIQDLVRIGRADHPAIATSSKQFLVSAQLEKWASELAARSEGFAVAKAQEIGLTKTQALAVNRLSALRSKIILKREKTVELLGLQASEELGGPSEMGADREIDDLVLFLERTRKEIETLSLEVSALLSGDLTLPASIESERIVDNIISAIAGEGNQLDYVVNLVNTQNDWIQRLRVSDDMQSYFLKSKRIIAGTCIGFLSEKPVKDLDFDFCILDEASKATSLDALVPFVKASRWLLVGDTQQLQARYTEIERESELIKEFGIEEEDLQENLFGRLERELPDSNKTMLSTQYRMVDEIGRLVSEIFYDSQLESNGPPRNEFLAKFYKPVRWASTSNFDSNSRLEKRDGTSYFNDLEAKQMVSEIQALDNKIHHFGAGKVSFDALVVAPYNSQLKLIKNELSKRMPKYLNLEFNSVDAVQGKERDIVFFSTVRSNNNGQTGFLSATEYQRVNVALSRARQLLVIVGDANFWLNSDTRLGEVVDYIAAASNLEIEAIDAE
jgi:serine/threonine protein kinase